MGLDRRQFLLLSSAQPLMLRLRRRVERASLGEVVFCRVSEARLLAVARSIYPDCIASHEPRPDFDGITFCGAKATLTVAPDRLP